MKVVAENRHEIWVSFGVALAGVLFSAARPMSFRDVVVLAGCLLVSLFCAVNAVLDLEGMSIPGKFFSVIWLAVVSVTTVWVLVWAFGIQEFYNK